MLRRRNEEEDVGGVDGAVVDCGERAMAVLRLKTAGCYALLKGSAARR